MVVHIVHTFSYDFKVYLSVLMKNKFVCLSNRFKLVVISMKVRQSKKNRTIEELGGMSFFKFAYTVQYA